MQSRCPLLRFRLSGQMLQGEAKRNQESGLSNLSSKQSFSVREALLVREKRSSEKAAVNSGGDP